MCQRPSERDDVADADGGADEVRMRDGGSNSGEPTVTASIPVHRAHGARRDAVGAHADARRRTRDPDPIAALMPDPARRHRGAGGEHDVAAS
jgi:hypothetical protein